MTEKNSSKKNEIKLPTIDELAKAGVSLGHKTTKRSPKMTPYIYGIQNTINIINLEKTQEMLKKALDFVAISVKEGKTILFLGTKPSAKEIIKKYAQETDCPYVIERWLGGTLTNFNVIMKQIKKMNEMNKEKEKGDWKKYTKKEIIEKEKELNRLEKFFGGLAKLEKKPDILYIVDITNEKTATREAKRIKIPAIAMVNTNANPELVSYPIPSNDCGLKSIELITKSIADTIKLSKETK